MGTKTTLCCAALSATALSVACSGPSTTNAGPLEKNAPTGSIPATTASQPVIHRSDVKIKAHFVRGASMADLEVPKSELAKGLQGPPSVPMTLTPGPVYSFSTGSLPDTPDAQVAVSATDVCITARSTFGCYGKGGNALSIGFGFPPGPVTATDFFTAAGYSPDPDQYAGTWMKDARIIFDRAISRFVATFETREPNCRLMIAVSQSQDPRDGWITYEYRNCALVAGSVGQDYQWLGYSNGWVLDAPIMQDGPASNIETLQLAFDANVLKQGGALSPVYWSQESGLVPASNDSSSDYSYYVTPGLGGGQHNLHIWDSSFQTEKTVQFYVASGSFPLDSAAQLGGTVDYANTGSSPTNAQYMHGNVTFTSNISRTWSGVSGTWNAVRLAQLDVSNSWNTCPDFSNTCTANKLKDRQFGLSSEGDPPGSAYHYGWPGVAANWAGNVVIGSLRTNGSSYADFRGSVWPAGGSLDSSISLKPSTATLNKEIHMAGVGMDGNLDGGVWLSQLYGTSAGPRMFVAKMLGGTKPDIVTTSISGPTYVCASYSSTYTLQVTNDGTAYMPPFSLDLYLSTNSYISTGDAKVASVSTPLWLAPGGTFAFNVTILPDAVGFFQGDYWLGPILDTTNAASENSETNNVNPRLGPDEGNYPIYVNGGC